MLIYAVMSPTDNPDLDATRYPNVLISYLFDPDRSFLNSVHYRPQLFLDSGAFSVWSVGEKVDVEKYADWALAYFSEQPGTLVANLDVIPGKPGGGAPTMRERKRAAAQGMANADYLRSRGLRVIEAYHRYEAPKVLRELIKRRQPGEMLALGGLVGGTDTQGKIRFCDSAFATLRDECGWEQLPPVHGFGVGADSRLGRRYPWYSIDSVSWVRGRRFRINVARDGSWEGVVPTERTMKPQLASLYNRRVLTRWALLQSTLTEVWQARGVRFVDDPIRGDSLVTV